jgi:hypothetical protein
VAQRWEYMQYSLEYQFSNGQYTHWEGDMTTPDGTTRSAPATPTVMLNRLGSQGWELVTTEQKYGRFAPGTEEDNTITSDRVYSPVI